MLNRYSDLPGLEYFTKKEDSQHIKTGKKTGAKQQRTINARLLLWWQM